MVSCSILACYLSVSTIQRFFTPQQVRRGSNRGEHRHPQAGRTDFRPADRQGKAFIAGEKKKATNIRQHHRRYRHRLLGSKEP